MSRKGERPSEAELNALDRGRRNPRFKGGRAIKKEADRKGIFTEVARELAVRNPEGLKKVLGAAARSPVLSVVCARSGVNRQKLRYWLELSRKGRPGDGFDVPLGDGRTERFHILYAEETDTAWDNIEQKMVNIATGVERVMLTHEGRVVYQLNPDLLAIGQTGVEAYLRDKYGNPIPETVPTPINVMAEMIRWVLSRKRQAEYGNRQTVQVDHKHSGVLVVAPGKTSKELEERYSDMRHDTIQDVEFEEVEGDTPVINIETEGDAS